MGDIVLFLLIVIVFASFFLLYHRINKKNTAKRKLIDIVTIINGVGALLGILSSFWEKDISFAISIVFFSLEFMIIIAYWRFPQQAYVFVVVIFLFQIPIVYNHLFDYRIQTLLGLNIELNGYKLIDFEPGSYIVYFTHIDNKSSYGVNLIPVLMVWIYSKLTTK